MLKKELEQQTIILGSKSPRRKELLKSLGLSFKITNSTRKENYPKTLKKTLIPEFLAKQKAIELSKHIKYNELLITADTIVLLNKKVLNKPKTNSDAFKMLSDLSNKSHQVITGVCIKKLDKEITFSNTTQVTFKKLSKEEINYYIKYYNPLDKAGGYGIQDWIGKIGIYQINGSYSNVMGLPLSELYQNLKKFV